MATWTCSGAEVVGTLKSPFAGELRAIMVGIEAKGGGGGINGKRVDKDLQSHRFAAVRFGHPHLIPGPLLFYWRACLPEHPQRRWGYYFPGYGGVEGHYQRVSRRT